MTVRTIFDSFFTAVFEMAAAFITQEIQGTIAEKTVKAVHIRFVMAWEIFTLAIAKEFVTVFHN